MRRIFVALACALLTAAATARAETAAWDIWAPSESLSGGAQQDPRLDKAVSIWEAGLPMSELAAALRAQTGVELRFLPGDDSARVCVNMFLNPSHPPDARSVLAQVAWVLDCSVGYAVEGGSPVYCVLHTSAGEGATKRLLAEGEAEASRAAAASGALREEARRATIPRLEDLRGALELSREDLIARYAGKDDLLLLALLDASRRATARLLLTVPEGGFRQYGAWDSTLHDWEALTPEQQALVIEALQKGRAGLTVSGAKQVASTEGFLQWVRDQRARLSISFALPGGFSLALVAKNPDARPRLIDLPPLQLLWADDPGSEANGESLAALDTALGRPPSLPLPGAEDNRGGLAMRVALQRQVAQVSKLSSKAAKQLDSVALTSAASGPARLWQVQEAAAVATGMHVISDCFWQPVRSYQDRARLLGRGGAGSARDVLAVACAGAGSRSELLHSDAAKVWAQVLSWEWGDAGSFLRFRSKERDLWREAFLPESEIRLLKSWVAPHLPQPKAGALPVGAIVVPLEPRQYCLLAARLRPAQLRWGGRLTYGSPTDARGAYEQAFRQGLLDLLGRPQSGRPGQVGGRAPTGVYRFLGGLPDARWEKLTSSGVVYSSALRTTTTDEQTVLDMDLAFRDGDLLTLAGKISFDDDPRGPKEPTWRPLTATRHDTSSGKTPSYLIPLDLPTTPVEGKHIVAKPVPPAGPTP